MTIGTAFGMLGIPPTEDSSSIQQAFALRSRHAHPEDDPEAWRELLEAYRLCMDYAKHRSAPKPELLPPIDSPSRPQEASAPQNTDYYDLFQQLDQSRENRHEIEQQLSVLLELLDAQQTIRSLKPYRLALELLSQLVPFASYDSLPDRVCSVFRSSVNKRKLVPLFKRRLLRLLNRYPQTLVQADEVIAQLRPDGGFAALRASLKTIVFPALLWAILVFAWMARFVLVPLFILMEPVTVQVPDGTVQYHAYSDDLPEGSYVKTTLTQAHWVGIGYWDVSTKQKAGAITVTVRTCHQYLFLQAQTQDGRSVLLPMVQAFSDQGMPLVSDSGGFFRSCSELAEEINRSGSYPLLGQLRRLDYPVSLSPGIPLWLHPLLTDLDDEMRELLPGALGAIGAQDQTPEEYLERLTRSDPNNQLFSSDTMGLYALEQPPEEGTALTHEEKLSFLQNPAAFLRSQVWSVSTLIIALIGAVELVILAALKKGKIPHVVVK